MALSVALVSVRRCGAPRYSISGTPSRGMGSDRLYTLPVLHALAPCSTASGVMRLSVPRSSSFPHRPQLPVPLLVASVVAPLPSPSPQGHGGAASRRTVSLTGGRASGSNSDVGLRHPP